MSNRPSTQQSNSRLRPIFHALNEQGAMRRCSMQGGGNNIEPGSDTVDLMYNDYHEKLMETTIELFTIASVTQEARAIEERGKE